jgi:hypothetical protein
MNAPRRIKQNRQKCVPTSFHALLAIMILWALGTLGQQSNGQSVSAPASHPNPVMTTNQQPSQALAPGVKDILQLADAGVSSEVIKSYVEYSATPYQPTGPDIIALKAHNVSDEIVTLLLKRGAQVRTAIAQARSDALTRALSARKGSSGLDPESYDYFRYYYLQPRALASAYERLFPYYNPSFASPFAYPPGAAMPGNQPFLNH